MLGQALQVLPSDQLEPDRQGLVSLCRSALRRGGRQGRTIEHEVLGIHPDERGRAVYTARPSGQQPAAATAISVEARVVTVENLGHDYRQCISFRASDASTLLARIEGPRGGRQGWTA
ncbi:DUF6265 family protein [Paucibacter sp. APW11]|uniref:DUF6265 family protein n=1 Tax=Roseateles aquae TaxID=3077235 RepID=A0ABU3PJR6_9BURK|nr:DUF6265 family protein [Paucibacter sp. APW11]MDT9002281.1 DUF6265 family protein [Paucibacter sp. APW11]